MLKSGIFTFEEGLCVQMMHQGSFDDEINTVEIMNQFLQEKGYRNDFNKSRLHHEIYLSDARKMLRKMENSDSSSNIKSTKIKILWMKIMFDIGINI